MKILDVPRSGSYQGITSSRNRFGQYVRTRATPVNPASAFQGIVRARLAGNAAAWRTLDPDQQAGWLSLGLLMSRTDSLGQVYNLTGFQAYCSVNNNFVAAGESTVADAPILSTPSALETLTPTIDSTTFDVAYTPTPLPAATKAFIRASPQRNAGRAYEGDYRLIAVTAAAAASPADILAAYTARFGVPVTGNKIFTSVTTFFGGFESAPILAATIVG